MKMRQRMTWKASDRQAAAPPMTPGYGVEDQDHPAHTQDDPDADEYMIGGPSEFGEDPFPPPYGDSGPPALPGVGVEDQDHPAHAGQTGRQASLMAQVRKKSAKCLVLARKMLPKTANWAEVEDQAFAFMDMADDQLDASLGRMSGDFLADEDPMLDGDMPFPEESFDDESLLDDGFDDEMLDDGLDEGPDDGLFADEAPVDDAVMGRLQAVENELVALKQASRRRANQNDPKGPTLGASGKSAEQEKAEEKAVSSKSASKNVWASLFDSFDTDGDTFVTAEDWKGPKAIFAAFDTDGDGIIARHEVLAKAAEDEEEEAEEPAEKEAADKHGFGHVADLDEEEMAMLASMRAGKAAPVTGCGDEMLAKHAGEEEEEEADKTAGEEEEEEADKTAGEEEEEEETSDKEASEADFFTTGFDPMGLAGGTTLTAADEAAFAEVFGRTAGEEEEAEDEEAAEEADKKSGKKAKKSGEEEAEEETEEEDEGKKASVRTASSKSPLRPQPRKPSTGVKRVGTVAKTASGRGGEIDELSKLWNSAPDVSDAF